MVAFEYRSPVTGKTARLGIEASSLKEAKSATGQHRVTIKDSRDPRFRRRRQTSKHGNRRTRSHRDS